jgi:hypothetical protein
MTMTRTRHLTDINSGLSFPARGHSELSRVQNRSPAGASPTLPEPGC